MKDRTSTISGNRSKWHSLTIAFLWDEAKHKHIRLSN